MPQPRLVLENISDPGTKPHTVRCLYQFAPAWYTIHWGDTNRTPGKPSKFEEHVYDQAGIYWVAIVLDGDAKPHAVAQIDVRDTLEPEVSLKTGEDPRYSDLMYLMIDKPHGDVREPYYDVDWGDTKVDRNILARPGTKPIWHGWNTKGDYVVKITDKSTRVTRRIEHTVGDPNFDPDYTLDYDTDDASKMTAKLTVTKVRPAGEGEVKLLWGDDTDEETVPNTVGYSTTHTYDIADWFALDLYYPLGGEYKRTTKFFAAGGAERAAGGEQR